MADNVYLIHTMLVAAPDAPTAAKRADMLNVTGYPVLINRPTTEQKAKAAINAAQAMALETEEKTTTIRPASRPPAKGVHFDPPTNERLLK